jgi:hypothetical protein
VRKDQKVSEAPAFAALLGGAAAGVSYFIFAYPTDYIKTLMQTDELESDKSRYKNVRHCIRSRFKHGGLGTFYKGLGVTLFRAAFVNAGGFFAFESTLRLLGKD